MAMRLARTTAWWLGTTSTPVARVIRLGHRGQVGHQVEGVGYPAVVGEGILPDEA